MVMQTGYQLILFCVVSINAFAQTDPFASLKLGDPAPPLQVRTWLKGEPVQTFEKGRIYVLEFWATWCAPCKAAMPHLSVLARAYKDKVSVLGIDVMEMKTTTIEILKTFVDSMGERMDYQVAIQDSNYMVAGWMEAAAVQGIPQSFVVDAEGRLAWIGHPKDLDKILPKVVNNTWSIHEALDKNSLNKLWAKLDVEASEGLMKYLGNINKGDYMGKPDSALLAINKIVGKEPRLKYAPAIAYYTFSSLLKTDPHKACEYGKVLIVTSTYDEPAYDAVIGAIGIYSSRINFSPEIYQLGADAYQVRIDRIVYPELVDMPRLYTGMAEWYYRANNQQKAINAQQKAIEALTNKYTTDMQALDSRLQQYKKPS